MAWQLQTAKQRFSELVDRALAEGPQIVTRRGQEVVAVVAIDEYRRLHRRPDFKRFLRTAPDFEQLDLERDTEPARTVDF